MLTDIVNKAVDVFLIVHKMSVLDASAAEP